MSDDEVRPVESSKIAPFTGSWFRYERERLAIGRRVLAKLLHVTVDRLQKLERRRQIVPTEWDSLLVELGFRYVNAVPEQAETPAAVDASLAESPPTAKPSESDGVAAPVLEPCRGLWLRFHRQRQGMSQRTLSEHLGVPPHVLSVIELKNRPLPAGWSETLAALGFPAAGLVLPVPGAESSLQHEGAREETEGPLGRTQKQPYKNRRINGHWLRKERERLGYSVTAMQSHLRVKEDAYAYVESRGLIIPVRWRATLHRLGFLFSKGGFQQPETPPTPAKTDAAPSGPLPPPISPSMPLSVPADASSSPQLELPPTIPPMSLEEAIDLVALSVGYRLKFGRIYGQTPVEILAGITHDLRMSGAEQAIPFEAVERAAKALLAPATPNKAEKV